MPRLNKHGGVVPYGSTDRRRAAEVDLITLPMAVRGTNCGNCRFVRNYIGEETLACVHPAVAQPVTARMCCALWDAKGTLRTKP